MWKIDKIEFKPDLSFNVIKKIDNAEKCLRYHKSNTFL